VNKILTFEALMNIRLKRLHYRSWHRGCKETDIVLGQFADSALAGLSAEQLDLYEKLLEEDDVDIWNWLTGEPAPAAYAPLIELLKVRTH
jgi:antitoxin CptB